MSSMFSERLDFLMRLTSTSNSSLARALTFDASYISRIRTGKRGLPKRQPFIAPASAYLAARIREPYQRQALEQAMRMKDGWPGNAGDAAALLEQWLDGEDTRLSENSDRAFDVFPPTGQATHPFPSMPNDPGNLPDGAIGVFVGCYRGREGKRQSVMRFLSNLAEDGKPHTLLLYSDESMAWLTEDPAFADRWAGCLLQVLENGGRITIIHALTREIGEMLEAVQKWLPLYLTGGVESRYCPRLRDGICRRTLFIAQGEAALTSNAIENNDDSTLSQLSSHPIVVQAAEGEFFDLLSLCRPLVTASPVTGSLANAHALDIGANTAIFANESVTAESIAATISAAFPEDAQASLASQIDGFGITASSRLPRNVAVFLRENDAFSLIHLANPRIELQVNERLLSAALTQYLRS